MECKHSYYQLNSAGALVCSACGNPSPRGTPPPGAAESPQDGPPAPAPPEEKAMEPPEDKRLKEPVEDKSPAKAPTKRRAR